MKSGLYIHIPFCKKRCNYCDFYTKGGFNDVPQSYIDAIKREILQYENLVCTTVYFGGGTPSLLSPIQLKEILSILNIENDAEITLEANPETLTLETLKEYYKAGVNRLSLGVQTVYNNSLNTLGRIHSNQSVKNAFKFAKQVGFTNISGDLMIGLDNYTYKEMTDTIDFLEQNGATHISAYLLKVEEGTPFYANPPKNLSTEEQLSDFYLFACDYLNQKGYIQYEISNFAKDGKQSKHNNIYWKLNNYIGIGPSAHSCLDGKRFYYKHNIKSFINGNKPIFDGEVDVDDYIMLSLRLKTGLDLNKLKQIWGIDLSTRTLNKIKLYHKNGYIIFENNCISLTPKGFLVENAIASDIMAN